MHPRVNHAEGVAKLADRKLRWDPEEERLLAINEVQLVAGERHKNLALSKLMPGRTVEAIKSHQKSLSYKAVLDSLVKEINNLELESVEELVVQPEPLGESVEENLLS